MHAGPFALLHEYFELDDTDSLYDDYWKEAREHLEGGTVILRAASLECPTRSDTNETVQLQ